MSAIPSDLFQSRKCIHIKLRRDVHKQFRHLLIDYNLSMQEVIDEFASLCASGDRKATALLDTIAKRKIDAAIAATTVPKPDMQAIGELDHGVLYDLIDSPCETDEENT